MNPTTHPSISPISPTLRPFRPKDTPAIIAVVRAVHDEYGFTWDEGGYHSDLYQIETTYLQPGGMFNVLELNILEKNVLEHTGLKHNGLKHTGLKHTGLEHSGRELTGQIIGCAAVSLHGPTNLGPTSFDLECELHRMYLLREHRGKGHGRALLESAFTFARAAGCRRMIAWSDIKLPHAHHLYKKSGFTQEGERRCNDPDHSLEFGFWKQPI